MGEAEDNTVWENSDLWPLSPSRGDNLKSLGDKDKVLSVFTNIMECHQIISWSTQHWWLNIVRVDWALWTWFIYVCVGLGWPLLVCLFGIRYNEIPVYVGRGFHKHLYCPKCRNSIMANLLHSDENGVFNEFHLITVWKLLYFNFFLPLFFDCFAIWCEYILFFLIPFLSLCNLYLNTSLVLTFFLVGCFGVNKKWLTTNAFLWKCRKQLKTLTSSNEGLKTNYVSRRVQTHLRFLKSDWSIKSYWERKAIYQSIHPFIIMYIRKRRLNRVNPLGYYYTYSKHKKLKATTFLLLSSDI